jgi:hypothetical protein
MKSFKNYTAVLLSALLAGTASVSAIAYGDSEGDFEGSNGTSSMPIVMPEFPEDTTLPVAPIFPVDPGTLIVNPEIPAVTPEVPVIPVVDKPEFGGIIGDSNFEIPDRDDDKDGSIGDSDFEKPDDDRDGSIGDSDFEKPEDDDKDGSIGDSNVVKPDKGDKGNNGNHYGHYRKRYIDAANEETTIGESGRNHRKVTIGDSENFKKNFKDKFKKMKKDSKQDAGFDIADIYFMHLCRIGAIDIQEVMKDTGITDLTFTAEDIQNQIDALLSRKN